MTKSKLKASIEQNAYNEDQMLWAIKARARSMGIKPVRQKSFGMPKGLRIALIGTLVLVFGVLSISRLVDFNPLNPNPNAITVIYALDINPSFEIAVNKADKVVEITAVNDDAKTIIVEDLLGMDSAQAIEILLQRSEAAGFIDAADLVDDYILITSIPMSANDEEQSDAIDDKLAVQTKTSEFLQSLNVAVIKSDLITLREAQGKKIPVGLLVINGMVSQPDGTFLSAKQFFSNPEYRSTFQTKGEIKEDKVNTLKSRILAALAKLDGIGVDTADIKNRLITAEGKDLIDIQTEVRKLLNKYHLNSTSEADTSDTANT